MNIAHQGLYMLIIVFFCSVRITTAQYPVPSICAKNQMDDWFDSLAECLHWNVRKQQKPLSSTQSTNSLDSLNQFDLNN